MILIEETTVPDLALPVSQFKSHLRQGTGFTEDSVQEAVLNGFLRAAIAAIEARTGKVLIERAYSWELTAWRGTQGQVLPVAPVSTLTQVTLVAADGAETDFDLARFRLEKDSQQPRLVPAGAALPTLAAGAAVRVRFTAGLAADWDGLPADLGQAVLMLAAHYYEYRNETSLSDGCMPFGVTSLIQRYRNLRVSPGYVR